MKKAYKYIIELDKPVWPRHIADEMLYKTGKIRDAKLISVKDLQYDKHIYGDTYFVTKPNDIRVRLSEDERKCFLAWLNEDE